MNTTHPDTTPDTSVSTPDATFVEPSDCFDCGAAEHEPCAARCPARPRDAAHMRDARPTDRVLYERTDPTGDTLRVTHQSGMTLAIVRTDCPHPGDQGGPHAPGVMLWPEDQVALRDALTAEIDRRATSGAESKKADRTRDAIAFGIAATTREWNGETRGSDGSDRTLARLTELTAEFTAVDTGW